MATYTFDKIKYDNNIYVVSDSGALKLTGGQVTGPVTFGDSVAIDEATIGDLVVNGSASFANNISANTINGVTVGSSPKFTDTVTTITTTGSGNAITAITASNGALTATKGSTFLTASDISGKIDTAGVGLTKSGTTLKAKLSSETAITDTSKVYMLGVNSDGYLCTKVSWSDIQTRTSDSGTERTIYLAGGTTATDETGGLSKHGAINAFVSANTATAGVARLNLGNSTVSTTAGGKEGVIRLYSSAATYYLDLKVAALSSSNKTITFPNKTGTVALTDDIQTVPSSTDSATTGITASTTATKTTLGTAGSVTGVQSTTTTASKASGANGSASTWAFEEVSIPNVTAAGSASTWAFTGITVANSISGAVDANDSTQLNITLGTTTVQSKSSGGNGTAPTLGTEIKVQSKKSGANGTAPSWSFTDVTVPIKNASATSIPNVSVASATVSITDNGHTHSIS